MPPITCTKNNSLIAYKAAMPARERGVIMVITLIALVVLMIGGIALIRSFDTSMLLAGNLAFRRDLVNQGSERWPKPSRHSRPVR